MGKIKVFINKDFPHQARELPGFNLNCPTEYLNRRSKKKGAHRSDDPAGKRDFVSEALRKPVDDWDQEFSGKVDAYLNRMKGKLERISSTVIRRRRKIENNADS